MGVLMVISISNELELLAQALHDSLSPDILKRLAKETKFVQRDSKFQAQELVALCVWFSQQVAGTSLVQLCSTLETSTHVLMSTEGLNQRFNEPAVHFLQQLLAELMKQELITSDVLLHRYGSIFHRMRILDSTTFQLPDAFEPFYKGSGGSSHTAGLKIQLEYDLLSGKFLYIQPGHGKDSDKKFGSTSLDSLEKNDLFIRDLGYFDLQDLQTIHDNGAYYISRLKVNTHIYLKNEHPDYFKSGKVRKNTLYHLVDMEELMNSLEPDETIELPEAYIGINQKLPTRVIIHLLTEEQYKKRQQDQAKREKKKGITYIEKSKRLTAINVYITDLPECKVPKEHVHDLYSLRWQVEILFKTWKSFFQIDQCKGIKKERLECHLYGQLISIFLCSSTMFHMRQLLLKKKQRELSEFKAIYMIKDYFLFFHQALQKNTQELSKLLLRLFRLLEKNGQKSHRYEKKTVFDILGIIYHHTLSKAHYTA